MHCSKIDFIRITLILLTSNHWKLSRNWQSCLLFDAFKSYIFFLFSFFSYLSANNVAISKWDRHRQLGLAFKSCGSSVQQNLFFVIVLFLKSGKEIPHAASFQFFQDWLVIENGYEDSACDSDSWFLACKWSFFTCKPGSVCYCP